MRKLPTSNGMETPESEHEKEKIERLRRAMYSRELSEKLKERPRREMDDIRPIVGEEWKHEEPTLPGSMVAPRSIVLMRKALWWILAFAVVFFLGAASFFTYYFTLGGGSSPASAGNIDILISGPPQIAGGEPTQLQISVTNRNPVPLQLADLVITYPPGTRSPTDLATDLSNQRIALGTIEPGGRRQGTVTVIFAGSGGETKIKIELEYRLVGSSAIFVASTDYTAGLSSSPISLSVEGNKETVSGQPVEFTVTVSSNANTVIKDVLLTTNYPFGFTYSSATPKPDQDSTWNLGDLSPGQKRQIVIRGTLLGESGDERVFRFTAGTRKTSQEKTISTTLAEYAFPMKVSEPFLGLVVSVNKSTGSNIVVTPGTNVNVAISWQNNLSTAIRDAVIVARLTGVPIDGATVVSSDGFFRSSDGVVIWDKSTTKGMLSNLPAGARGLVSFSFRMPGSESLGAIRNPTLTFTVNAAGKRISEDGVPENLQAAMTQRIVLSSDLQITAQGLYYANPFGSVGPLPPKADTETTYAVVFTISNTTNKITNARIEAALPPYVRWVGITSPFSEIIYIAGKIYEGGRVITPAAGDPCQGSLEVCWSIGDIDAGVGINGTSPRQAAIAIGFTPSSSQIGQEPPLAQEITFRGVDSSTGNLIERSVKNVTSNIVGDPGFSATQATVVR